MNKTRLIPLIVALSGLVLFLVGLLFVVPILLFVNSAVRTEATVVDQRRIITVNSVGGGDRYRTEVMFKTLDNTETRTELSAAWGEHTRGDKIHILYDPQQPNSARHDHFWSLWMAPIILLGTALVSWHSAGLL